MWKNQKINAKYNTRWFLLSWEIRWMIEERTRLISFSTTFFVSLWYFFVLHRWKMSNRKWILCFFDMEGGGDYTTVAARIRFYLKKLKIFLFFFPFPPRISSHLYTESLSPQLRTTGLRAFVGLRSETQKTVCTFILFITRVNSFSYLLLVRISFVSLYPPSHAQSAQSRASQRENSTAIDLFDKNDFGRKVQK